MAFKKKRTLTLFFDCETTGLNKHPLVHERYQPECIEFYGCLYDLKKGEMIEELELLILPTRVSEVPEKITKITGITQAMLEGKPTFADVADSVEELIAKAQALCGHNVTFDVDVIEHEFKRLALPLPSWPPRETWTCTVEQTMHIKGHRLSLEVLHEMLFGEKIVSAHRAKADVLAHIRVVEEMIRKEML
jgi:DNA polymerase III epsilon subunit-like protein